MASQWSLFVLIVTTILGSFGVGDANARVNDMAGSKSRKHHSHRHYHSSEEDEEPRNSDENSNSNVEKSSVANKSMMLEELLVSALEHPAEWHQLRLHFDKVDEDLRKLQKSSLNKSSTIAQDHDEIQNQSTITSSSSSRSKASKWKFTYHRVPLAQIPSNQNQQQGGSRKNPQLFGQIGKTPKAIVSVTLAEDFKTQQQANDAKISEAQNKGIEFVDHHSRKLMVNSRPNFLPQAPNHYLSPNQDQNFDDIYDENENDDDYLDDDDDDDDDDYEDLKSNFYLPSLSWNSDSDNDKITTTATTTTTTSKSPLNWWELSKNNKFKNATRTTTTSVYDGVKGRTRLEQEENYELFRRGQNPSEQLKFQWRPWVSKEPAKEPKNLHNKNKEKHQDQDQNIELIYEKLGPHAKLQTQSQNNPDKHLKIPQQQHPEEPISVSEKHHLRHSKRHRPRSRSNSRQKYNRIHQQLYDQYEENSSADSQVTLLNDSGEEEI